MPKDYNAFLNAMTASSNLMDRRATRAAEREARSRAIAQENALRDALGRAYVPRQEAQPAVVPFSEATPGPMLPQEATAEIPGKMDWQTAMKLGAETGVIPEVMATRQKYDPKVRKASDLPSTVQEWQYYNSLPKEDQIRFLNMKRQGFSVKDIAGVPTRVPLVPGQEPAPLSTIEEEAKGLAAIAGAKEKAKQAEKTGAIKEFEEQKLLGTGKISPKEKSDIGKSQVLGTITQMGNLYNELLKRGGAVHPEQPWYENIMAKAQTSAPGQFIGKATGTEVQSILNQINSIRPTLINQIRQASGMGAKGMDSEKELEFFMKAATDPDMDHPANLAALNVLMATYSFGAGKGDKASIEKAKQDFYGVTGGQQQPPEKGGFVDADGWGMVPIK